MSIAVPVVAGAVQERHDLAAVLGSLCAPGSSEGSTRIKLPALVGVAVAGTGADRRRCSTSPDRHRSGSFSGLDSFWLVSHQALNLALIARMDLVRRRRQVADRGTGGVADRIQDRRCRGNQDMLAQALGAIGPLLDPPPRR